MASEGKKAGEIEDIRFVGIDTYRFKDKNGEPIPNEMGYAFILAVKGRTDIWANHVAEELIKHDREHIFATVKAYKEGA